MAPAVGEDELSVQEWFDRGFEASDLDNKRRYYSEVIRLRPEYVAAWLNRAVAYKAQGKLEEALRDYAQALRLKPDCFDAYYNRAGILASRTEYEAAVADYKEYLKYGGGLRYGDTAEVEQMIAELTVSVWALQRVVFAPSG